MKDLKQVSVLGLGLLGASVTLAVQRLAGHIKAVGYSHRPSTRKKAELLGVADIIHSDIETAVKNADLVILATPIGIFEDYFKQIAPFLKPGCIVTDVGSTKVLPHRWAKKLPKSVNYVGSHPIAGSEKRGVEFARDDLFEGANCIITLEKITNKKAANTVKQFWTELGSMVYTMDPASHDKMLGSISHLPHLMAAALVNANNLEDLKMAGRGFLDASRIASGPSNIWTDIFLTNSKNTAKDIGRLIGELNKLKKAVEDKNAKKIEELLEQARKTRAKLVDYKMKKGEILS